MDFEFPCGRVHGGEISLFTMEQNAILRSFYAMTSLKEGNLFLLPEFIFAEQKCSLHSHGREALPGREEEIQYLAGRLWRFLGESQCSIMEWDLIFDVVLILEKQSRKPVCIPPWFWYRFSVSISTFAYSLYFELISIPRYACFFIFASALRHAMVSL